MNHKNMDQKQTMVASPTMVWVVMEPLGEVLHAAARVEPASELQKLGWNVTMVAPGDATRCQPLRGFQLQTLRRPDVYFFRQLLYHLGVIFFLLRRWSQVDVVYFQHQSTFWLLPLMLLCRLSNRPSPLFVMDTRTVPMTVLGRRDKLRARFEWNMYRLGRRWADGHTAITRRMAEAVGVTGDRLWGVWPSGVNLEQFAPARRARHWPSGDQPVELIYIGALYPERNLMTLCQAVVAANQADMHFKLTIVGGGPEWEALAAMARQKDDAIQVLHSVPHEEVPSLLTQAHVGVLPFPDEATFRVSSPIKLFEYMASGLAIMATHIVCHTDVVGEGDYVCWAYGSDQAAMVDALQRCWDARPDLPGMGAAAAAAAPDWTWAAAARKLDRALRGGMGRLGLAAQDLSTKNISNPMFVDRRSARK